MNRGLILFLLGAIIFAVSGCGTVGDLTTSAPDSNNPSTISITPENGTTNVDPSAISTIKLTFSVEMDSSTVNNSTIVVSTGGSPVDGTIVYDEKSKTATFTPTKGFDYNTSYTVTITTGLKNSAGNPILTSNVAITFTTMLPPDNIAPTVASTSPADKETKVKISTTITAVFSEAMASSTINASTFTLSTGGNSVTGDITYDSATKTAAFTPKSNLSYYTKYTATITTGVKDLVGNSIASDKTWSFTTEAAVPGSIWSPVTTSAEFSARGSHTSVAFNNQMWVIAGTTATEKKNDVWYSSDGTSWTQAASAAGFSARGIHASVVFDNKIWVMGGHHAIEGLKNDVWYSSDGSNWMQATGSAGFSKRQGLSCVVFNGKMWVIGGRAGESSYNDVWSSTNGSDWTRVKESAEFSPREGHSCLAFNGKIWIIAGKGANSTYNNDVWYSEDGATWTRAKESAPFSVRTNHTSVVYDNKIWVIGGYIGIGSSSKSDVWYSTNGIDWTQATSAAGFAGRSNHTSTTHNNKMWVIGGNTGETFYHDVWSAD